MIRLKFKRRGSDRLPEVRVFDKPVVWVGREVTAEDPAREAAWQIPFEDVSRRQCRFERSGEVVCVEGLSPRSATFVNRARIEGITRLAVGDSIRFGNCEIVLLADAAAEPVKAAEPKAGGVIERPPEAQPRSVVVRPEVQGGRGVEAPRVERAQAEAPGPAAEVPEDMVPIIERAQRWDELGRPARGLLRAPLLLQRGRRWLRGGVALGGVAALVRTYVEASVQAQRALWQRRGIAGAGTVGALLAGALTAHVLARPLQLEGLGAAPPTQLECKDLARLDALVDRVEGEADVEVALLGAAALVEEAEEVGCLAESRAEEVLRHLLAGRRSERLGVHVGQEVVAVALDEVGQRAVTADDAGKVIVWHLERGRSEELRGVHARALVWSSDGKWLALGGAARPRGGEVVVYDASVWPPVERFRGEHHGEVTRIAFNSAGDRMVTGDARGELRLWAPRQEQPLLHRAEAGDAVDALAFDGGRQRIFALAGERATMWSVRNEVDAFGKPEAFGTSGIRAMAVSAAGVAKQSLTERVLTGDRYGVVMLWEVEPRLWGRPAHQAFEHSIVAVAFVQGKDAALVATDDRRLVHLSLDRPQGKRGHFFASEFEPLPEAPVVVLAEVERAVSLGPEGAPLIWDLVGLQRKPITQLSGEARIAALDLGKGRLLTGDKSGQVRVWNELGVGSGGAYELQLQGKPRELRVRGHLLACRDDQDRVRIWDFSAPGRPLDRGELSGPKVTSIAVSGDSKWVAGVAEGEVVVWQVEGERRVATRAHVNVRHVEWNESGDALISVGDDVREWRIEGGQLAREVRAVWALRGAQVERLAVARDQAAISVRHGAKDRRLYLLPVGGTGGELPAPLVTETSLTTALTFDTLGRRLAVGYQNGTTLTWALERGAVTEGRAHNSGKPITALSFAPEGPLAIGDKDGDLSVMDLEDRKAPVRVIEGHAREVIGVAFGESSGVLISAAREPRVVLRRGARELHLAHRSDVIAFAADPQGRLVATANDDALRVWPVAAEGLAKLTCVFTKRDLEAGEREGLGLARSPCRER